MRGRGRCLLICIALLGVLGAAPAPAEADAYDAIEKRLKTTGISPSLAREITHAIRKGAMRLVADQQKNGSWRGAPGESALAALALVHTGDEKAREAADRSRRWLQRAPAANRRVRASTYEAGIMAMLLHALAPDDPMLSDLQRRLARGPTGMGYWGYQATGGSGRANLSTSQFACLGLWAAERDKAAPSFAPVLNAEAPRTESPDITARPYEPMPEPIAHEAPLGHLGQQALELTAALGGHVMPVLDKAGHAIRHLLHHAPKHEEK